MSYLKEIEIKKLGDLENVQLTELSPGLNVVFGENGSGKSTLRNALRFAFFGLPQKIKSGQNEERHNSSYYSEANKLRDIRGLISDASGDYHFVQTNTDGKASGAPVFTDERGAQALETMLSEVGPDEYRAVFTLNSDEMMLVDSSTRADYVSLFMASTYGTDQNPSDVLHALNEEIKGHNSKAQSRKVSLARDLKAYADEQKKLEAYRAEAADVERAIVEKAQVETELSTLGQQKRELEAWISTHSKQQSEATQSIALREELLSDFARYQERLNRQEQQYAELPLDDAREIFGHAQTIKSIESDGSRIQSYREDLAEYQSEMSNLQAKLARLGELPIFENEHDLSATIERARTLNADYSNAKTLLEIESQKVGNLEGKAMGQFKRLSLSFFFLSAIGLGGALWLLFNGQLIPGLSIAVLTLAFLIAGLWSLRQNAQSESAVAPLPEEVRFEQARTAWDAFISGQFPNLGDIDSIGIEALFAKVRESFQIKNQILELASRSHARKLEIDAYEAQAEKLSTALADNSLLVYGSYAEVLEKARLILGSEQQLKSEITNSQDLLAQNHEKLSALEEKLESLNLDARILDEIATKEQEKQELEKQISDLSIGLGRLNQKIDFASNNTAIENSRARLEALKSQSLESARELAVTSIAAELLRDSMRTYDNYEAPDIMAETSTIFNRITAGEYNSVTFDEETLDKIRVTDKKAKAHLPYQLSRGTSDQLYLSLRLGMLSSFKKRGADLPIVLDDVFSSFDESRRAHAIKETIRLSEERQMIIMTHDQAIFDEVVAAAPQAKTYLLERA